MAKYWVLTNLLPGPIPQVSVYGLPGAGRGENQGKLSQVHILKKKRLNNKINLLL